MFIRIDVDFLFDTFIMNEEKDSELHLAIGWFFLFPRSDLIPIHLGCGSLASTGATSGRPSPTQTEHPTKEDIFLGLGFIAVGLFLFMYGYNIFKRMNETVQL
ncbi:TPA: hypothetical protein EYP70_01970 [Candidatus Bathyarchaeota archaeon]|nr:hypothetical protein [Candidatus Bathyarchaeota archaeon]